MQLFCYWKSVTLKAGLAGVYFPSFVIRGHVRNWHAALPLLVSYRVIKDTLGFLLDCNPIFPSSNGRILVISCGLSNIRAARCARGYTLLKA